MGAEVELGVGSDTWTLRSDSNHHGEGPGFRGGERPPGVLTAHPTQEVRAAGVLFALALGLGCGADSPAATVDAGPGASSVSAAEALVAGAPLPDRLEAVGLADAVAVASLRARPPADAEGHAPES